MKIVKTITFLFCLVASLLWTTSLFAAWGPSSACEVGQLSEWFYPTPPSTSSFTAAVVEEPRPCSEGLDDKDPSSKICFEGVQHPISTFPALLAQYQAEQLSARATARSLTMTTPQTLLATLPEEPAPQRELILAQPDEKMCVPQFDVCERAPRPVAAIALASLSKVATPELLLLPSLPTINVERSRIIGPEGPGFAPGFGRIDLPPPDSLA